MISLYRWLIRSMVNLKFAVGLLTVIGLVSIVATVLGGMYGEEVQMRIFRSAPFSALMAVFTLALGLAVASRWPWKRTHTGWIMTHAGLIVIVCGHLTTCHLGREGRVDLFEGQTTSAMEQDDWLLTADLKAFGTRVSVKLPLDLPPDVPLEGKSYGLPGGDLLAVERFWPTYAVRTSVTPDYAEGRPVDPAVLLELRSSGGSRSGSERGTHNSVREWLFASDPRENAKAFGDHLKIFYRQLPDAAAIEAILAGGEAQHAPGRLVAVSGDETVVGEVSIDDALAGPAAIGTTGFRVHVHRKFERFRLIDKTPTEAESGELNPALLIEVSDASGRKDHRWVFAAHGEVTAEGAIALPFELRYAPGGRDAALPPASLVLLEAEGADPVAIVVEPDGSRRAGPLVVGRAVALPWLAAEAVPIERHARAVASQVPWCSSYAANRPALRVSLLPGGSRERARTDWVIWNGEDRATELPGSSGPVELRYAPRKVPLGFTLQLKDFVLETYEGTENPKSFESFVRVIPHDGRPPFDYHIYMNHPLTHEGHTFFQSSYDPDTLRRSIFQVSYDPGWPVVYTGYALTVLGLLFVVYLKPILVRREAERRAAEGLARVEKQKKEKAS